MRVQSTSTWGLEGDLCVVIESLGFKVQGLLGGLGFTYLEIHARCIRVVTGAYNPLEPFQGTWGAYLLLPAPLP